MLMTCACFTSVEAAKHGLVIIEREFKRYGLVLSRPKTETMVVNDGDLANKSSILSLDDDKIKNVLELSILGLGLCYLRRNLSGSSNSV